MTVARLVTPCHQVKKCSESVPYYERDCFMASFLISIFAVVILFCYAISSLNFARHRKAKLVAERKISPEYGEELAIRSKYVAYSLLGVAVLLFWFINRTNFTPMSMFAFLAMADVGIMYLACSIESNKLAWLAMEKKISSAYKVESVKRVVSHASMWVFFSIPLYVIWLLLWAVEEFSHSTFTMW